jgi:hypothetical protein
MRCSASANDGGGDGHNESKMKKFDIVQLQAAFDGRTRVGLAS